MCYKCSHLWPWQKVVINWATLWVSMSVCLWQKCLGSMKLPELSSFCEVRGLVHGFDGPSPLYSKHSAPSSLGSTYLAFSTYPDMSLHVCSVLVRWAHKIISVFWYWLVIRVEVEQQSKSEKILVLSPLANFHGPWCSYHH